MVQEDSGQPDVQVASVLDTTQFSEQDDCSDSLLGGRHMIASARSMGSQLTATAALQHPQPQPQPAKPEDTNPSSCALLGHGLDEEDPPSARAGLEELGRGRSTQGDEARAGASHQRVGDSQPRGASGDQSQEHDAPEGADHQAEQGPAHQGSVGELLGDRLGRDGLRPREGGGLGAHGHAEDLRDRGGLAQGPGSFRPSLPDELPGHHPSYAAWVRKTAKEADDPDPKPTLGDVAGERGDPGSPAQRRHIGNRDDGGPGLEGSGLSLGRAPSGGPEEESHVCDSQQLSPRGRADPGDARLGQGSAGSHHPCQRARDGRPSATAQEVRAVSGPRKEPSASARLSLQLGRDPNHEEGPTSRNLGQRLSLAEARSLEQQSWDIVPELFQSLVVQDRPVLLEVACESTSLLSSEVQKRMGSETAAVRASLWNGHDLSTTAGVRLTLNQVRLQRPQHVWLSPPCGPFSPLQNTNQRTESQREALHQKRQEAIRMYVGAACIVHECINLGVHVTWEMSERCEAWRLPLMQRLLNRYGLKVAVTKGCQVNLRDRPQGQFLQKGWKIATTHEQLAEHMNLPCK